MFITEDIRYIGVDDHQVDLFEGQYDVPNGMAYNSYLILDEKTAVMDTVDRFFTAPWLENLARELGGRKPDYLIVQHMEPDHASGIALFAETYPDALIVSSAKAFAMMKNFFGTDFADRRVVVGEGSTLTLGRHVLTFVTAPMVHWPEVIVTYDALNKILFSADGFGRFGANDVELPCWADEARRYYIGIVGKYGAPVQALLKKAATLDIAMICPLHGPMLTGDLSPYLKLYDTWSSYRPEEKGVTIAYASIYGHTQAAAEALADMLRAKGETVALYDLARSDMAQVVADAFRYDRLVLASVTYNMQCFPCMKSFINHLIERSYTNRTVALIENGSWAPAASKVMRGMLEACKGLSFAETDVRITSSLNESSREMLTALAEELAR